MDEYEVLRRLWIGKKMVSPAKAGQDPVVIKLDEKKALGLLKRKLVRRVKDDESDTPKTEDENPTEAPAEAVAETEVDDTGQVSRPRRRRQQPEEAPDENRREE